jgi:molybdenum cofactor cytidylyltransferase
MMLVSATDPMGAQAFGAILLAAGGSSRLGRPKQLEVIGAQALVVRQAQLLLALNPACVVVVTGAAGQEVRRALHGLPVEFVHHADWSQGMGRSIARGIEAMPERVRGALLLLCDQWRIEQADLEKLLKAWQLAPQKAIVSTWDGISGPPVIFPRALFQRLLRLQGDAGARPLLRRYTGGLEKVPMANAAFDLDQPGDAGTE